MQTSGNVVELRELLAQRFPHVCFRLGPRQRPQLVSTGLTSLDAALGGGLARGEMTELVARGHGSGSVEVIHELLHQAARNRQFLALIDGKGSFDPGSVLPAALARLLWIRCQQAGEALKAADLLLRDRNFGLLVMDLKLNPVSELRKISSSTWFRYARLLEQNQAAVLVVTPQALVNVAGFRVAAESALGIEALERSRAELLASLRFTVLRTAVTSNPELTAQAV